MTPQPLPNPDLIPPTNPPKDPMLAVILNLLLTGVGYIYIGQWQKGIVALFGGIVLASVTILLLSVCIGVVLLPFCIALPVFVCFDVHKQATLLRYGYTLGQWTFLDQHRNAPVG